MAIRYDKKLNQEINKTIRNFNQKITRLEKQERDLILPDRITKQALKENIHSRKELRRRLKELQQFSTRGIEKTIRFKSGLELSHYEYQKVKKESARVKRLLTSKIKFLETTAPKVFGKRQAVTFAQMGDDYYLNLLARREKLDVNILEMTQEEFERYKELVEKTSRNNEFYNNIFKQNYIKALNYLGYFYNYDKSKLKYLEDRLIQLAPDKLYKLFLEDKAIQAILNYYPMVNGTIMNFNPEQIKEDVTELYGNLIDNLDIILKDYE